MSELGWIDNRTPTVWNTMNELERLRQDVRVLRTENDRLREKVRRLEDFATKICDVVHENDDWYFD